MKSIRAALLGALIAILGMFIGEKLGLLYSQEDPGQYYFDGDVINYMNILSEIWVELKRNYAGDVEKKKVFEGAMKGMVAALGDPYTRFLDDKELKEFDIDVTGEFGGLGIEITIRDNWLTVIAPIEGTPAYRAGIKPGDKIVEINGKSTKNMSLWEAVSKLRGKPGTAVNIKIMREGEPDLIPMRIVRGIIRVKSVKYGVIDYKGIPIGYVKLTTFMMSSYKEMRKALYVLLNKKHIKALILDLRNNPGGLLNRAVDISSLFLKKGSVVVSTKGKLIMFSRVYKTSEPPMVPMDMPMIVLINGGSASASEILSGALRDNKRAKLLGTKSFGKGSVQQEIKLKTSGYKYALLVTIAKYYTPSGISIHGKGLKPDYEVKLPSPTIEERLVMRIIKDKKFLEKFSKKYSDYSEDAFRAFKAFLEKRHLSLRDYFIKLVMKNFYNRNKMPKLYDLELDVQLKKALDIVTKRV